MFLQKLEMIKNVLHPHRRQFFPLGVRFFDPLSHPTTPPDGQRWCGVAVRLVLPFRNVFCQVPSMVLFHLVQSGGLGGLSLGNGCSRNPLRHDGFMSTGQQDSLQLTDSGMLSTEQELRQYPQTPCECCSSARNTAVGEK